MAWVDILRGSSGRHYIGSCVDPDTRFAQPLPGHTATTKQPERNLRLWQKSSRVGRGAANQTSTETQEEPRPRHLLSATVEQPRKPSGLVGSSNFSSAALLLRCCEVWA